MKENRNEIMKERARNERGYYLSQFDGVNNSEFLNEKARLFDKALGIYEKLLDNDIKGDVDLSEILSILITMYNGRPFTPIEDTDDIWGKLDLSVYRKRAGVKSIFRCSRMPLLLKCVYEDDKIIYEDHSRIQCYDISSGIPEKTYGLRPVIRKLIDDLIPITLPYIPQRTPIKVYVEESTHRWLLAVQNVILPGGESIDISKFYRFNINEYEWMEIDEETYLNLVENWSNGHE